MAVPPSIVRKAGVLISGAVIAAAGLIALAPAPAQAETVTLTPAEDTYVNQGAPSSNFGSASSLSSRGNPGAISYLRFTLPSAPAGSVLTGVSLRIKSSSDASATSADTHRVSLTASAWSESALTWNTRAAITGPQIGAIGPVTALNTIVSTALDPALVAPVLGGPASLAVTSSGTDSLYFWSSNHVTASYRPALVLTFGPSPTTTTTTTTAAPTTTTTTTTTDSTTTTTTAPPTTTTTDAATTTTTTGPPPSGPQVPTGVAASGPTVLTLAEPPRIALLNQQASSISGAVRVAPDDARLTYRGAADFAFGASYPDSVMYVPSSRYPHGYGSQTAFSVEFSTNAAVFEVFFKQKPSGMFRLSVDGRRTTALPMATGATISGGLYLLRFDLGTGVQRRITLDLASVPFGGVNLPPGATLTKVTSSPVRWAVLGDSISGGSDANAGYAQGTWVGRFGLLTGWTDAFNEALGGTGFVNPGTSAAYGDRVNGDIVAYHPQRVVVWGGYNDLASSQSAIGAAAGDVFSRITTGLPGATVYVVGCWAPTGSPGSALRATDETLRNRARTRGLAFVSPITGTVFDATGTVVAELGPWITGTGTNAAPRGDGNADVYVGPDRVHPTDAGHSHIAMKLAASVAALEGATQPGAGVSLIWNASAGLDGPSSGYEVHRASTAGFTPTSATLIGTTAGTSFVAPADDTGTFWYRLVAFDGAGGRSAASSGVSVTLVDDTSYVSAQRVEVPSIVSLTPTADTYVNQSAVSVNYGSSSSLGARGVTSAAAYLSFAIPAAPAGKTLTAATLTIRTNNDAAGGSADTFTIRLTSASWSESGMTWNNRAAVNGPTVGTLSGATGVNSTHTATLAPAGLAGTAGTTTTFVIGSSTSSTDSLYFWSRNYATAASRPTLTLSYN